MSEENHYIYFIESHIKDEKVYLESKTTKSPLKLIKKIEKENNEKENFLISIYRFKIEYLSTTIELSDKKDNKFESSINISSKERDNFIFNFKFDKMKKIFKSNNPPVSIYLTRREQFDLYYEILKTNFTDNTKYQEKFYIIQSIIALLIDYDNELEFSIYLSIIKETISFSLVKYFLANFELSKVKGIGFLEEKELKEISEMLNIIEFTYEEILEITDAEKEEEYIIKIFTIILYFNYIYNVQRIPELLNIEKINQYFYKGLIKYHNLFYLNLEKEHILNLINLSKNFDELSKSLWYCNDVYYIIEIVLENFSKFIELHQDSSQKIEITKICKPKKNDNIKKIIESYLTLYTLQKDNDNNFFLEFNTSLIDKYINFGLKFDDLISIKKMLNHIEKNNEDINSLFHKNGLVLIINGKLKNMEILNFIRSDNFYDSDDYSSRKKRSLFIINGLDINYFDEQFYLGWKKIKWKEIFEKNYNDFINKVLELVNDMKYFNILFKLLDESENSFEYEFDFKSLDGMIIKFIEIMRVNKPKDFTNYINDLVLLIVYSDRKVKMNYFLSRLRGILDINIVFKIYINILINYNDIICSETKNIIIGFFTYNIDKINPNIALNLLLHCPQLSENIFKIINKFIIQKKDIFQIKESESLTLLKGLIDENYMEKDEYKNSEYFIHSLSLLNEIKTNFEKGEISYNDIHSFYSTNIQKNENILISRLNIVFLNKKEEVEKIMDIIDKTYYEIKFILNDLQLILNDFKEFFPNKESANINLLKEIIQNIKNCKLNSYKEIYSEKYNTFINSYKNEAEERSLKKNSLFFKIIINNKKKLYEDDNDSCINETIKSFDSLKYIFDKENIYLINNEILKVCLNEIKGIKREDIYKEIDILEKVFKKEINNITYNKDEIINIFIYLINNLVLNDALKYSFNSPNTIYENIIDKINKEEKNKNIEEKEKLEKNNNEKLKENNKNNDIKSKEEIEVDTKKIDIEKAIFDSNKIIDEGNTKIDDKNMDIEKTKIDNYKIIDVEKNKVDEKIYDTQKIKIDENKNMEKKSSGENDILNDIMEKNKKILELENLNKELNKNIDKLKNELNEEKIKNKNLDEKIKELQNLLNKEKNNNILMEKMENMEPDKGKMMKLMEEIMEKDKELKEIKSRRPIELLPGEKLMTIIFTSEDQNIHYALICKNTDKFSYVEQKLYEKYNEYINSENYFLFKGNKISRFKSIEENGIDNSGVIILNKFCDEE